MKSNNFDAMLAGLNDGRHYFYGATNESRILIEQAYDLLADFISMLGPAVSKEGHEEKYLEIAIVILRRIVSSFVLLESGLFQEAQMVLRNAFELLLILIDVAHNKTSMDEWKKSEQKYVSSKDDIWYFKARDIAERVKRSKSSPVLEKWLAEDSYEKWKEISNATLHAYSYAQISPLIGDGKVQIFGRKSGEGYEQDFKAFGSFILNVISALSGVPAFSDFLKKNKEHKKSKELGKRIIDYRARVEGVFYVWVSSKQELENFIKANLAEFPIDISSIPDDAKIQSAKFDVSNQSNPLPILTVEYEIEKGD